MRVLQTFGGLLMILGLAAGCGNESPPPDAASAVTADATLVKVPFTLGAGIGVRLTLTADVETKASGSPARSQSMKVATIVSLRCTEVTPAGDRVAELRVSRLEGDGGTPAHANGDGRPGTMTIGPDRLAKTVELDGKTLPGKRPLGNPFRSGGLSIYVPLPVDGMRVGQTLVLPAAVPPGVLPPPVQRAVEASTDAPAFRGTYTLVKTHAEDGVLVGEFGIDISLKWAGKVPMGQQTFDVLVDSSCVGSQSFVMSTGLPVGAGEAHVTERLEMNAEGRQHVFLTTAKVRAECAPLK